MSSKSDSNSNSESFDRTAHLYRNDGFIALVRSAVEFFDTTPIYALAEMKSFIGTGVYALYCTGQNPVYRAYLKTYQTILKNPIYIGKAVPKGWRQARTSDTAQIQSKELFQRLREHTKSISSTSTLDVADFTCRFIIFEESSSDMIGTLEAALIKLYRPLWNSALDGFGNHDPGKGRYEQAKSDWDVLHPGRLWADKCKGFHRNQADILLRIEKHIREINL